MNCPTGLHWLSSAPPQARGSWGDQEPYLPWPTSVSDCTPQSTTDFSLEKDLLHHQHWNVPRSSPQNGGGIAQSIFWIQHSCPPVFRWSAWDRSSVEIKCSNAASYSSSVVKFLVKDGFAKNTPPRWKENDSRASIHPNHLTLESVHLLQLCMDFGG